MTDQIAPSLANELEQAAKEQREGVGWMSCGKRHPDIETSTLLTRAAALARAAEELADAAFDYHVHSELAPVVEGVEKTVRLLDARNTVRALVSSEDKGE